MKRTQTTEFAVRFQKLKCQLESFQPTDRESLANWIYLFLGLRMPEHPVCTHHQTPLDYLTHSFFEKTQSPDSLVWACRGGGKTTIGAVATLLDLLFKPGIQIRILGGSFDQSQKMYDTLLQLLHRHFSHLLKSPPTQRRLQLLNGSRVDVLSQSDRSIRGQRVQKLRCDEVELFDPKVWQAAQLTTRTSLDTRNQLVRGSLEAFSTMHKPNGLMHQLLNDPANTNRPRKTFAWCIWDVIQKCPDSRTCDSCPLWKDCQGRAKSAHGFVPIEDVIAMKTRVSNATWDHEMLCLPPRFENAVFPAFRRNIHVISSTDQRFAPGASVIPAGIPCRAESIIAGVDFGYSGAFVSLWIAMLRTRFDNQRVLWVFDEMLTREQTVAKNADAMTKRPHNPTMVYCDIAGRSTNSQTGRTDERVLRDAGFNTRARSMRIDEGIGMIADLLDPAFGPPRLLIDPRCENLIRAFESYRRLPDGKPDKDGTHDHPIDALRYAIVGNDYRGAKVEIRYY